MSANSSGVFTPMTSTTITSTGNRNILYDSIDAFLVSYSKHKSADNKKVNPTDCLHDFWHVKQTQEEAAEIRRVEYEYDQSASAPICYVILPGGACFGSYVDCVTPQDAQRSAAKLALMTSVFNEHPSRRITDEFIYESTRAAISECSDDVTNGVGIQVYNHILTKCKGKSMLEFQELMTIFRLLHWNDSLRVMRQKQLELDDVLKHYSGRELNTEMRSQMAMDWVAREEQNPGLIRTALKRSLQELGEFRCSGKELRFFKEKRDILMLAEEEIAMRT